MSEIEECTFDPKINTIASMKIVGVGKEATNDPKWKDFEAQRKRRLYRKGRLRTDRSIEEVRYERERGECTF